MIKKVKAQAASSMTPKANSKEEDMRAIAKIRRSSSKQDSETVVLTKEYNRENFLWTAAHQHRRGKGP